MGKILGMLPNKYEFFGGLKGKSLLDFARAGAKVGKLCLAKSFGHRSKTAHCAVFSLRSIPLIIFVGKNKRGTLSCTSFIFGGPDAYYSIFSEKTIWVESIK